MVNPKSESREENNYVISLKLLGGLLIAFLSGYFTHNLIANANSVTVYTFSTPELINFVLSVVLSGASIILAVSAISLGKFSEQAMIQRSDESIRLQNEVFQKTTDALQRIESSTGVTEKRLEDIISGRVGDLSQKIARIATESKEGASSLQPKEIEDLIRKTLLESLPNYNVIPSSSESALARIERMQAERKALRQKYDENHSKLEFALKNRKDLRAIKLGQGQIDASGLEFFDDVFVNINDKKIGIVDFPSDLGLSSLKTAVTSSLKELREGTVDFVHILTYEPNPILDQTFNEMVSIILPEYKTKIRYSAVVPDKIDDFVKTLDTGLDAIG
jgi:hypothetical protein